MSNKVTEFTWRLDDPATPPSIALIGKKPKKNRVTLDIVIDEQDLSTSVRQTISSYFTAFQSFRTNAKGNQSEFDLNLEGKQLRLVKGFEFLRVRVGGREFSTFEEWNTYAFPTLQVSPSSTAVNEGQSLAFFISSTGLAEGTTVSYELSGANLSSADFNNAPLTGFVQIGANGRALVSFLVSDDLSTEGAETAVLSLSVVGSFEELTAQATSVINDTSVAPPAPVQAIQVAASAAAVSEGGTLTFFITTQNVAPGTQLNYELSGVSSADVGNAPLIATTSVLGDGTAQVTFNLTEDLSTEGPEPVTFNISVPGGPSAQAVSVVNDTSLTPVEPNSFILTDRQDFVAGSDVSEFAFIGNENTLGQGDRLSIGEASEAVLEIAVAGEFNLNTFSTEGIDTLEINGDGVATELGSSVAMSNTDIRNILISKAIQESVLFNDLQVDDLFAVIQDSVGNYEFNFDASQLNTGRQQAIVLLDEIPVDQENLGVGLYFSQSVDKQQAKLEELSIGSFNASGDASTNFTNILRKISVGDFLDTLNIAGTTSLEIQNDLGLPGSFANPFITEIDAEGLFANLTLTYTTQIQDGVPANDIPDVVVTGAQGNNIFVFDSTGPAPADFGVTTFSGNDSVATTFGDDTIAVGEGDNFVSAGEGINRVTAGNGNNIIFTGSNNDNVVAGDGDNTIAAGDGNNVVVVGNGNNGIVTGVGDDTITAGTGDNVIRAGDGNNTVNAGVNPVGTGNNKVITGIGRDVVNAGDGDDVIVVGDALDFAADVVNSGGGNDLVITGNGDDEVVAGSGADNVAVGEGTVEVDLGLDSDALWIAANNLEGDDFINGGTDDVAGARDQIIFTAGGTVLRSETAGVTNIEQFTLLNLAADPVEVSDHPDVQQAFEGTIGGAQADYDIALSDALVDGSNDLTGGVRRFTVDARNANADVTLDIRPVETRDEQFNLKGVTYLGSAGGYTEKLIVSDEQLNSRLIADFDQASDIPGDILEIVDTTDATVSDLRGISNVDVILLNASGNTAQTFTITLDEAFVGRNATPGAPIIIRATNGLPPLSQLNLDVSAVTSAGATRSIVVEKSSNLIVNISGDPLLGQAGAKVQVVDAFFLTSNDDDLNGTINSDIFVVDSANDLNPSDVVDGGAAFDTMLFEFGVSDGGLAFGLPEFPDDVLSPNNGGQPEGFESTGYVALVGSYDVDLVNPGMGYGTALGTAAIDGFDFEGLPILSEAVTQVTNLLNAPIAVDPNTFEGIRLNGEFVSSSQPDFPEGVAIAGLPYPGYVTPTGQTLESQLDFIRVQNVEKFVFNPSNDNGVRFVGFNSPETFETPGFFLGDDATLQQGQLDLLSLEILQTFDANRAPNAGAPFALIEGDGAPLNDILFLDDYSWNIDVTTNAEQFWNGTAVDLFDVNVADFSPVGFQAAYNFARYNGVTPNNNFEYGSFFDSDVDSEAPQQRRSFSSSSLDFALEVDTGAGNDYIFRPIIGTSANGFETGTIEESHYLAGYLIDSGSGDDVVVMDDMFYAEEYGPFAVEQFGIFGGLNNNIPGEGSVFFEDGNPFYSASGDIEDGPGTYADDVILTRSGNDFVVDYGGDNIVYSGIGNDFVLTGYGNDFIISDDDDELDASSIESEIGAEALVGPASSDASDNDIILADGPLVGALLQFSPQFSGPGAAPDFLGQVSPGVFGQDYVRDLSGDNIISTGGNNDTVVTGLGDDIILAGTLGDLGADEAGGRALFSDSDVINDLGGHNLIVTLGDDDYIESGDGSDVILAGFGDDDDVVFAGGGADLIEFASGSDYIDAGAGNDFMASLLGAEGPLLSLDDGNWNGLTTGDTILGGDGFDSLLLAFGGSQDDTVIAPRLVNTFNDDGVPTTVSASPNPGAYPGSYEDDATSVNPIMDSVETLILFSDDADIYLTDTVARQAKNRVEVTPGVFADQVTVFLNDLEYDGLGSGIDIVLDASAFEADSSLRAFAFNIGASDLQSGISGSAGLRGGSGVDFLAAGSFLQDGILAGGTDVAELINEIRSFLDNQALDNFVGADVSAGLSLILDLVSNQLFAPGIQDFLPSYPAPGIDPVAQIQTILDALSENLSGDFVEDFISYQGNGSGDFITLEPTVLLPDGSPLVPENTVEFVRYVTIRDGADAGEAFGFDKVFNFNNTDTALPFDNADDIDGEGVLTNSYTFVSGVLPTTTSQVDDAANTPPITGDKIVFGGGVGQIADLISKNGNQLVDLFKRNEAVNWSSGRFTPLAGQLDGDLFESGDEALFVDAGIQITNDEITNFAEILAKINSFGTTVTELNQGGLIVINGNNRAMYGVYQETDGNFANIAQSEFSILGVVEGIDTNSFRLQASDFILDNGFMAYTETGGNPVPIDGIGTAGLPISGPRWDSQAITDPTFNPLDPTVIL